MKTVELTGVDLAYWVARAIGTKPDEVCIREGRCEVLGIAWVRELNGSPAREWEPYEPHERWGEGGPLIEQRRIELLYFGSDGEGGGANPWEAQIGCDTHYIDQHPGDAMGGPTPLIAAMRALVASVYGDTVPDEAAR